MTKWYHSSTQKPLAPYGKAITQLTRKPRQITVVCGGWTDARGKQYRQWQVSDLPKALQPALVLPPDKDPTAYRWPVAGVSCLVIPGNIEPARYNALANCLMESRALDVIPMEHHHGDILQRHKRQSMGVAA